MSILQQKAGKFAIVTVLGLLAGFAALGATPASAHTVSHHAVVSQVVHSHTSMKHSVRPKWNSGCGCYGYGGGYGGYGGGYYNGCGCDYGYGGGWGGGYGYGGGYNGCDCYGGYGYGGGWGYGGGNGNGYCCYVCYGGGYGGY